MQLPFLDSFSQKRVAEVVDNSPSGKWLLCSSHYAYSLHEKMAKLDKLEGLLGRNPSPWRGELGHRIPWKKILWPKLAFCKQIL